MAEMMVLATSLSRLLVLAGQAAVIISMLEDEDQPILCSDNETEFTDALNSEINRVLSYVEDGFEELKGND